MNEWCSHIVTFAYLIAGTVKEILGTASSVGCTIDGQSPQDLIQKIKDGELEIPEE